MKQNQNFFEEIAEKERYYNAFVQIEDPNNQEFLEKFQFKQKDELKKFLKMLIQKYQFLIFDDAYSKIFIKNQDLFRIQSDEDINKLTDQQQQMKKDIMFHALRENQTEIPTLQRLLISPSKTLQPQSMQETLENQDKTQGQDVMRNLKIKQIKKYN